MTSLADALAGVLDHRGRTPKKLGGDFSPIGVPVISARNVKDGRIVDGGELRYVDIDMWHRWMPTKLQHGDVLLTSEAPLGEVALIGDATEYCLGQRLFGLRPDPAQLLGSYLYYWLQSAVGQDELHRRASGTTAQGIRQAELMEVEIELPDVADQAEAVRPLEALDALVDTNREVAKTLEGLFGGLFRLWFAGCEDTSEIEAQLPTALVPTPEDRTGRRPGQLGDIGRQLKRAVKARASVEGTAYIGLEHIPRRRLTLESWGTADSVISNTFGFEQDEILFGKLRPYFHKVAIAPTNGVCSTDVLVLNASEPWRAFFLGHVFSSELIDHVDAASGGTRMPRTSWETIARYEVELPAESTAARFSEAASPILRRLQSVVETNRALVSLRDRLLGPLVEGSLRPADVRTLVKQGAAA